MGSAGSRPRLRKVAPCRSLQEEGGQHKAQWTLPALPVAAELQPGSLGQRKTTLPPLKQEVTLSTLSEPCLAGNTPPKQSNNTSIIHSHPPRRPQALQPLALQSGHICTANQIVMGRDCRDGPVHRFSTTAQTGHSGTGRVIQSLQGGFLEAQTALSQQAHRHRRAHLRQVREQRRRKVVHTVNDTEGVQRLKLVRRPTERDIFWDESTGERLDPSSLLPPKSPQLCEDRQQNQPSEQLFYREERLQRDRAQDQTHRAGHGGLSEDKNLLWTTERESAACRGKTERNSWMESKSPISCRAERMRGVRGLWDYEMD